LFRPRSPTRIQSDRPRLVPLPSSNFAFIASCRSFSALAKLQRLPWSIYVVQLYLLLDRYEIICLRYALLRLSKSGRRGLQGAVCNMYCATARQMTIRNRWWYILPTAAAALCDLLSILPPDSLSIHSLILRADLRTFDIRTVAPWRYTILTRLLDVASNSRASPFLSLFYRGCSSPCVSTRECS
jgi:hypothetical protein